METDTAMKNYNCTTDTGHRETLSERMLLEKGKLRTEKMAQWLQMLLSNHEHPLNRLRIPQTPAVQFQWNWSSTLPSLGAQVHIHT